LQPWSQKKKKRVLDLNTNLKVVEVNEKARLTTTETVEKINAGKSQVDDTLKGKSEMRSRWQNCVSGSGIQGVSKFVQETSVKAIFKTF
jgi:hypothetical protein